MSPTTARAAARLRWPFVLAGGLKIGYDRALDRRFRALAPPEER